MKMSNLASKLKALKLELGEDLTSQNKKKETKDALSKRNKRKMKNLLATYKKSGHNKSVQGMLHGV